MRVCGLYLREQCWDTCPLSSPAVGNLSCLCGVRSLWCVVGIELVAEVKLKILIGCVEGDLGCCLIADDLSIGTDFLVSNVVDTLKLYVIAINIFVNLSTN